MLLSVIIPTCHRNDLLALCLDQLASEVQTLSNEFYEVIVTDDGSKSTAEQLIVKEYPWVKWVDGPRKGPAANRNNGAKHARGEWLVFIDDDCMPDKKVLSAYYDAILNNPETRIFEGKIITDRQKMRYDEESPINVTGGYLWSCNFCISNDTFVTVKGFDETFPFACNEDVDFRIRLLKYFKIRFIPEAIVCHPWRIVKDFSILTKRRHSYFYLLKKHPELIGRFFVIQRIKELLLFIIQDMFVLYRFHFKGWRFFFARLYSKIMTIKEYIIIQKVK